MTEDLGRLNDARDSDRNGSDGEAVGSNGEAVVTNGEAVVGGEDTATLIGQTAISVARPAPGQDLSIGAEAGQRYAIEFSPDAAQVRVQGNDLILEFPDGASVTFQNLGAVVGQPDAPVFEIAGQPISSTVIFGQAVALAGGETAPPSFETAAAPSAVGTGATRYDDDTGQLIDLLDAQPVIPGVEREFRLIDLEPSRALVDETNPPVDHDVDVTANFIESLEAAGLTFADGVGFGRRGTTLLSRNFMDTDTGFDSEGGEGSPGSIPDSLPFVDNNGTLATAQDIPRAAFRIEPDPNLGDDSLPSVVIDGLINQINDIDYYRFELQAGEAVTLDIDFGSGGSGGGADTVDIQLVLLDEAGNVLVRNDDSPTSNGGAGSASGLDSFLQFTAPAGGVFFVGVTSFNNDIRNGGAGDDDGNDTGDYVLNISVDPTSASTGLGVPVVLDVGVSGSGGAIFVTGHDSDEHGNTDYMTSGLDFLAFGHAASGSEIAARGDLTVAIIDSDNIGNDNGQGISTITEALELAGWTVVWYDLDNPSTDFSDAFASDLILIGSGGDTTDNTILTGMSAQFEAFINNGGGLYINTDEGFGQSWYDFVPSFGTTQNNNIGASGIFTPTAAGNDIGLTEAIVDRDITHSFYTGVDTELFTVFELTSENNRGVPVGLPVAFGTRNIGISGGEFVRADVDASTGGFLYEFQVGEAEIVVDNIHGTDVEDGVTRQFTITSLPTDANGNPVGFLLIDRGDDNVIEEIVGLGFGDVPVNVQTGDSVFYFLPKSDFADRPDAVTFNYFTTDSDGLDSLGDGPATVTINLPDPVPTVTATDVSVDEDDIPFADSSQEPGSDFLDGEELVPDPSSPGSFIPDPADSLIQSGTISANFSFDEPGTVGFTQGTIDGLTALGLTSSTNDLPLSYEHSLDGLTLTAMAGSETVFQVTLSPGASSGDFDYSFELIGSINHLLTDDPATADVETKFEDPSVLPIQFQVTDLNGDTATGTFDVTIVDDVPTIGFLGSESQFSDGVLPGALKLWESDINLDGAEGVAPAHSQQSFTLVYGADGPESDSSAAPALALNFLGARAPAEGPGTETEIVYDTDGSTGNPVLTSGGETVTVVADASDPKTIFGFIDSDGSGTPSRGDVRVFIAEVNPGGGGTDPRGGVLTFDLFRQLDHPDTGEVMADDNIRFEFSVTVTDDDGDADTLNFTVDVDDSGPTVTETQMAVVDEDGLQPDGILGGPNNDIPDPQPVSAGGDGDEATFAGNLGVDFGADRPGTIDFASLDGQAVVDESGVAVLSHGQPLTYIWDAESHTLTAVSAPPLSRNFTDTDTGFDGAEGSGPLPDSLPVVDNNGTLAAAQDIPRAAFGIAPDPNLGDDSLPSVIIDGLINEANDIDYYRIELQAGETVTLDIDFGENAGADPVDTQVFLLDAAGNVVVFDDDTFPPSVGGAGSVNSHDSFIQFTAPASGAFFVGVTSFDNDIADGGAGDNDGRETGDYVLNVSIDPTASSTGLGGVLASGSTGGSIFITGHDSDEHENYDYDSAGLDYLLFGGAADASARDGKTVAFLHNGPNLDSGTTVSEYIDEIRNGREIGGGAREPANNYDVTFFDLSDPNWTDVFAGGFDAIMVGSVEDLAGDNPPPAKLALAQASRDALVGAEDQFAGYINAGGGLFIHTDGEFGQSWYDFVPQFGTVANNTISATGAFSVTPAGTGIGLTEPIVDAHQTHSFYTGVDTSLFTVFEVTDPAFFSTDQANQAVAFGARGIGIQGGEFGFANEVFTLEITDVQNGDYVFTLLDQVDHTVPDGPGPADENNIFLNLDFLVTDFDGDTATGTLPVQINDDSPMQSGRTVMGTVEEEQLGGGNEDTTPDLDGDTDADLNVTTTVVSGSLAALVDFGADGPSANPFSLSLDTGGLPAGLTSVGETLVYDVTGNVLTAYVDSGTTGGELDDTDRPVFTLELQSNGDYSFTLLDQLDHHPVALADDVEGNLAIDFSSIVAATDFDGDTITLGQGAFTIKVIDDVPVVAGTQTAIVDEDGLQPDGIPDGPNDISDPQPAPGGDGNEATFAGNLGVDFGADKPGDIDFAALDGQAVVDTNGVAVLSHGNPLLYQWDEATHTLTAVNAPPLSRNSTDTDTGFDSEGSEEGPVSIPGSIPDSLPFVDNNGTLATAQDIPRAAFRIEPDPNLGDDSLPSVVINGLINQINDIDYYRFELQAGEAVTLDIDFGRQDFGGFGDPGGGADSVDIQLALLDGAGNVLVRNDDSSTANGGAGSASGSDSFLQFTAPAAGVFFVGVTSFDNDIRDGGAGDGDGTDTGDYVLNISVDPTPSSTGLGGIGNEVFTLEVTDVQNGDYTFTLLDQVDHTAPDEPGTADENDIFLDLEFLVTDFDGDTATGSLPVRINDDSPMQSGQTVMGVVEEEHLPGGNEDTFPAADGDTAVTPPGSDVTTTVASGSVAGLVSFGADQPGTFSLSTDTSGLPALTSNGETVQYGFVSNPSAGVQGPLVGFVDVNDPVGDSREGVFDSDDRLVFSLHLNPNGSYIFELRDQLDHPLTDDPATADTETAFEDILGLDFSSVIQATDFDGDTITLTQGTFTIDVIDDVPVQTGQTEMGVVEEEQLLGGNEDVFATPDLDLDEEFPDNTFDDNTTDEVSGSIAGLVNFGADQPGAFGLSLAASTLPDLTSAGEEVFYDVTGNVLTAYVDSGTTGGELDDTDRSVFTLELQSNGDYSFTLLDQLDHHPVALADDVEGNLAIDFSSVVTATDFDGDTIALGQGAFTIKVIDDVPVIFDGGEGQGPLASVVHDETPGIQLGTDDTDRALPAALALLLGTPIGVAVSAANAFSYSVGADQPGGISLTQSDGVAFAGVDSGLARSSDDTQIFLFSGADPSVVLGRAGADVAAAETGDIVFAVHVDGSDNSLWFAQYDALEHRNALNPNDAVSMADRFYLTVTDEDGDSVTANDAFLVQILDDGPSVAGISMINDETLGLGDATPSDDTDLSAPLSAAVLTLVTGDPINTSVKAIAFGYGADGPGGVALDPIDETDFPDGKPSGLFDTATDQEILLFNGPDDTILGRVGDANGPVAFVSVIGTPDASSANLWFVQYTAIQHDNPFDPDEVNPEPSGTVAGAIDTLDFNGLATGTYAGTVADGPDVFKVFGAADTASERPILVSAINAGISGNAAVIFDSANPFNGPSGLAGLGTPNEAFDIDPDPSVFKPGPGVGDGGGSNDTALEKTLIVSNESFFADDDGDGLIDVLFVQGLTRTSLAFDFSLTGPVTLFSITAMDIGGFVVPGVPSSGPQSMTFNLYDSAVGGALLFSVNPGQTGDNGVVVVDLGGTAGVVRMEVVIDGSGAVDNLVFQPGGEQSFEDEFLTLGYTVIDADGDTVSAAATITIEDDGPTAIDDAPVYIDRAEGGSASGDVFVNDDIGVDGAVVAGEPVTLFSYLGDDGSGTQVELTATAGATVTTLAGGQLTVNADGTWDYFSGGGDGMSTAGYVDDFSYIIKDGDGDTASATQPIRVVLNPAAEQIAGPGGATLTGDAGDDFLRGGGGADTLDALGGNDLLFGGGGDDTLIAGTGDDQLYGDGGADTFSFSLAANEGTNTIGDFSVGEGDTLEFSDVVDVGGDLGPDFGEVFVAGSFSKVGSTVNVDLQSGTTLTIEDVNSAIDTLDDLIANSVIVV